jgi:esterase/lipase
LENLGEVVLSTEKDTCYFWPEYYREFPYFSEQTLRLGCFPRKLLHNNRTEKAIVLVHGLTDSPFYMLAIAEYFHKSLGYNVYLPLLQCHGLKNPEGMAGVSLEEWKKNVRFAIRTAAENADGVSIGGLSMGGALSLYFGGTDPAITGDLYLFSAALGIYGGRLGVFGGVLEFFLRLPFVRFLDNGKLLVGHHPYRYDRVPLNSAKELARLILELDRLLALPGNRMPAKRIFAAWSEFDRVINVNKLSKLQYFTKKNRLVRFIIPKAARVDHACVVLKEPVYAVGSQPGDSPLEEANPGFAEMMAAVARFESAESAESAT